MSTGEDTVKSFWHYDPSMPIAVVATVLYGISFIMSLWQTIRHRAWIWIVMVMGIGMEFDGFIFRVVSINDHSNRLAFILQFVFLILAPVLMAGAIYVAFGRIVFHIVPQDARTTRLLWVPPRFVTPIFVGFDIFALFLQTMGAVLVSATQATDEDAASKIDMGKTIAMAGIAVQMVAFGLFTVIAARFQITSKRFMQYVEERVKREPGEKRGLVPGCSRKISPNWRMILYAVNASCVLVLIRSVFRMIEFDQGPTGEVSTKEFYLYVLDVIPMLLVCLIFNLLPPGTYLPFMDFRLPAAERKLPGSVSGTPSELELQSESYQPLDDDQQKIRSQFDDSQRQATGR